MNDKQFFLPAWALSLTLHGVAVGLAFIVATQIKPVLPEDLFQWDVALVEGVKSHPQTEAVTSAIPPEPQVKKLPSEVKRVSSVASPVTPVEPRRAPPQPPVETVQPVEPKVEAPQRREEPAEQQITELIEPHVESVVETKPSESIAMPTELEPVESQPQQQSVIATSAPTVSPENADAQTVSSRDTASDHVLATDSLSGPEAKVDNRWLAESLWRRVAELKRYPTTARMNGQEGKVVVKATIRSDGQLADVMIQKSSGYSALDAAALEAVKLACPIHMKQALGKPHIVVTLPIIYRLSS